MNELLTATDRFNWQTGYGAFSVSESQASRVFKYIRDQKRHHQKQSFENELELLLAKHAVSYDAKYIWD
jgi:putative transposase